MYPWGFDPIQSHMRCWGTYEIGACSLYAYLLKASREKTEEAPSGAIISSAATSLKIQ